MADIGQIRVLRKLKENEPIDCENDINALIEIFRNHPDQNISRLALFALIDCRNNHNVGGNYKKKSKKSHKNNKKRKFKKSYKNNKN